MFVNLKPVLLHLKNVWPIMALYNIYFLLFYFWKFDLREHIKPYLNIDLASKRWDGMNGNAYRTLEGFDKTLIRLKTNLMHDKISQLKSMSSIPWVFSHKLKTCDNIQHVWLDCRWEKDSIQPVCVEWPPYKQQECATTALTLKIKLIVISIPR